MVITLKFIQWLLCFNDFNPILLGPLLLGWFILAWISNYIHYKVLNGITYPFPNFKSTTVEIWEWIKNVQLATQKCKGHQGDCPGRHWGRWSLPSMSPVTRAAMLMTFCFCEYVIIGLGNGLTPKRCQAITWTNDDYVPCGINSQLWVNLLLTEKPWVLTSRYLFTKVCFKWIISLTQCYRSNPGWYG